MSRAELHRRIGLRPNTVGEVVDAMTGAGWVREAGNFSGTRDLPTQSRGRPAIMVEIDESCRDVVGLALGPGRVEAVRLSLRGKIAGEVSTKEVRRPADLAKAAARLLDSVMSERSLAIGVSSTGLLDEGDMKLLFSSSAPRSPGLSLGPVLSAGGDLPIALENNIHALGDRWRLRHPEAASETVLLIELGDGAVGASFMPAGPADAGCVRGGNELGHAQVSAPDQDVPGCYCGQSRCLERVFSTAMAGRLDGSKRRLASRLTAWGMRSTVLPPVKGPDSCAATDWIVNQLAEAVGNAVNLLRPHRVVWTGAGTLATVLRTIEPKLSVITSNRLLPVLRERVRFGGWHVEGETDDLAPAVTAGYLALAMLTDQRLPAVGDVTLRAIRGGATLIPSEADS